MGNNIPTSDPYWDGSRMINTKAIKLSKGKSSATLKAHGTEDSELKVTTQQVLINTSDQQTLHFLHRANMDTLGSKEGNNGISTLGPSYHGPRDLLLNIRRHQEAELKVAHSTATTHQGWVETDDQLTLVTCARASLDSLEDSNDRNGIFILGSNYYHLRFFLTIIERSLDKWMKVTHSTAGAKQYIIDLMTSTPCETWFERIV